MCWISNIYNCKAKAGSSETSCKTQKPDITGNKFALLWDEAQLCLPYVCLYKKIAYSYPKVT